MDDSGLTLFFSILAGLSALCAIISFTINRKKDNVKDGENSSWLKSEITYVRNSLDDLRLEVKEYNRKQNEMNEKLVRVEEQLKSVESRVCDLEGAIRSKN